MKINSCEMGYSLIEVLVAVTILALIGISSMSLSGYHKFIISRVETRFMLTNALDSFVADIKYVLQDAQGKFPYLEPADTKKVFEGDYEGYGYTVLITKTEFPGTQEILKLQIDMTDRKENADSIIYLSNHTGETQDEDS